MPVGPVERAARAILALRYGPACSEQGWRYVATVDNRFVSTTVRRRALRTSRPATRTRDEPDDLIHAATHHLARVFEASSAEAKYAVLEELTVLDTPALTLDADRGETFTDRRLLNVVIVGAGPIGLLLASALKVTLHDHVDVLVLDNRVSAPHRKHPYERRWVTNIPHAVIAPLVEPEVASLFASIGGSTHIGATINILETVLLLSCRRLGVRFRFTETTDLSFVTHEPVHFVFDASGGRFAPPPQPQAGDAVAVRDIVPPALRMGTLGSLSFPLLEGHRIRIPLLKLIHVPVRSAASVESYLNGRNWDRKFFVWSGTLQPTINQAIVVINLTTAEYEYLCEHQTFPLGIGDALATKGLRDVLDERIIAVLRILNAELTDTDAASIDAPFLYEPYLVDDAEPVWLHEAAMIRVGDSIYNGYVKIGNGLGPHIQYVSHICASLARFVTIAATERINDTFAVRVAHPNWLDR